MYKIWLKLNQSFPGWSLKETLTDRQPYSQHWLITIAYLFLSITKIKTKGKSPNHTITHNFCPTHFTFFIYLPSLYLPIDLIFIYLSTFYLSTHLTICLSSDALASFFQVTTKEQTPCPSVTTQPCTFSHCYLSIYHASFSLPYSSYTLS